MVRGSCLCGEVAWEADGPFELMAHCHCSRCRKATGSAFTSDVAAPAASFRLLRGGDAIARHASAPGSTRAFCARCGSVVPDPPGAAGPEARIFLAAASLDDDPGARPLAHIFVGSQAPWYEIADALPRFAEYPPGFGGPARPPLERGEPVPGAIRGSCLCGDVRFLVEGEPLRARYCHCSRCRKARSAAHAANLFVGADGVRFTRGEERLRAYKVPEARYFTQVFCARCGSPMPRIDRERDLAVVPMGSLDDDPGLRADAHIFAGSRAPWEEIAGDLPRFDAYPPE